MNVTEPWLSVEEIAGHLGISKETVYKWLERKKIPAHRIGKLWKFKASEVDEWVMKGHASQDDADAPNPDSNEGSTSRRPRQ